VIDSIGIIREESRFVFRSKRLAVMRGVFVMPWRVGPSRRVAYKPRLYKKTSSDRHFLVQVSRI